MKIPVRGWYKIDPETKKLIKISGPGAVRRTAAQVKTDEMDPIQSMVDGKIYTSKSKLRASYKAAGKEEIGNEDNSKWQTKPKEASLEEVTATAERAYTMCRDGMAPMSEREREVHKITNRQYKNRV